MTGIAYLCLVNNFLTIFSAKAASSMKFGPVYFKAYLCCDTQSYLIYGQLNTQHCHAKDSSMDYYLTDESAVFAIHWLILLI